MTPVNPDYRTTRPVNPDYPRRFLADINPCAAGSMLAPFAVLDGELIVTADDGVHGVELWAPTRTA